MKKLFTALVSNVLMIALPLLMKPALIIHYKILLIIMGSVIMWLTQPEFSVEETKEKKDSDNFTVVLILIMSFISVVAPVIDWAYFSDVNYVFTIFSFFGLAMIVTGLFFRIWAVKTLGKYFTPTIQIKPDHELITGGPYNIVRHPSYSGAFLCISGGAVLLESWIGLVICFIAMGAAYFVRINLEEKKLIEYFGHDYELYKQKTKVLIPFIW